MTSAKTSAARVRITVLYFLDSKICFMFIVLVD
jgi:hypothetical protein